MSEERKLISPQAWKAESKKAELQGHQHDARAK